MLKLPLLAALMAASAEEPYHDVALDALFGTNYYDRAYAEYNYTHQLTSTIKKNVDYLLLTKKQAPAQPEKRALDFIEIHENLLEDIGNKIDGYELDNRLIGTLKEDLKAMRFNYREEYALLVHASTENQAILSKTLLK